LGGGRRGLLRTGGALWGYYAGPGNTRSASQRLEPRMVDERTRYSQLMPLPVEERRRLAVLAVRFFAPLAYRSMCEVVGKVPDTDAIRPLNGRDFLSYLSKTNQLAEPNRDLFRIRDLLSQLASRNILTEMGAGSDPIVGKHYYFLRELTRREQEGWLWLAPALGPEYILNVFSSVTFQLTGTAATGDAHAGTGIAFSPRWILTCGHVVTGMQIDEKQVSDGKEFRVVRALAHGEVDVALVEVDRDSPHLPGLAFRNPVVAETVYTLGYPRIPLSRSAPLVMQRGEVSCEGVMKFSGEEVFLYSAIARPGNSGGPVVAETGHVVGIVAEELSEEASRPGSPFHAGIGASEILRAVADLEPSVAIPVETYE
jgi:hypothetical protein